MEGRVIMTLPGTIVQTSLLGSFLIFLASFFTLLFIIWLIKKVLSITSGSRNWLGALSKKQRTQDFYQSINAMLMNEHEQARKLIDKTTDGDFQGTNFLIAAELARRSGDSEQAQAYLIQAMDYPICEPLALMKQAGLCIHNKQYDEAMNLLSAVEGNIRKTRTFVVLKLRILEGLNDWEQIQSYAKENKKLLEDDYFVWAQQWTVGEFSAIASKHGANALKLHWQELSRAQRKDQANQIAYLQLLIDQGLSAEAEKELIEVASKQHSEKYWGLFKQLNHPNPALAIKFIEQEIKKSPQNAALYSVLAHLAYNMHDFELANKAIVKALELKDNVTDKALLAAILEKRHEFEQANVVYRGLLQ